MKKLAAIIAFAVLYGATYARATCTQSVTVATTATQVIPADDLNINGRNFLMLQNIGASAMFCAIGSTATTSNGVQLNAGSSLLLESVEGQNGVFYRVPPGAVSCIASGSPTTATYCDY